MKMIAMRVVGLMIAFGGFIAGLDQTLDFSSETASNLTFERAMKLFTVLDVNRNGIVEKMEYKTVTDCFGELRHMDEMNTKRIFHDYTKWWKAVGFENVEDGDTLHKKTMLSIFETGKHSPIYGHDLGTGFVLISDVLKSYNSNNTVTFDAFLAFHFCIGADTNVTRHAFEKIDSNKDGEISDDEMCIAGVDFMTGDDKNGKGSLFFG